MIDKKVYDMLSKCEDHVLDSYSYMVLKPFAALQDLMKEEQFHAAVSLAKSIEEGIFSFQLKLEAAKNDRLAELDSTVTAVSKEVTVVSKEVPVAAKPNPAKQPTPQKTEASPKA